MIRAVVDPEETEVGVAMINNFFKKYWVDTLDIVFVTAALWWAADKYKWVQKNYDLIAILSIVLFWACRYSYRHFKEKKLNLANS